MECREATMENLGLDNLFGNIYKDRSVLVTGHTGFKGSWLSLWLKELGAKVIGYSLKPLSTPNHFDLLKPAIVSIIGDIKDTKKLDKTVRTHKPEIVFHLAAQSLVRYSYKNPVETYETNVIGTVNVFEACRNSKSVKAILNITSDKCYENREWVWGYRENDPMGGHDPYSASKGCAELITSSYRNSFFNLSGYLKTHNILLASARAGNVIGGGDWAYDRLIPDIMRAVSKNEKVRIRNPKATRPWQHVLEPLSGYLMLGQRLLEGDREFAEGWNFGPGDENSIDVETVIKNIKKRWDKIEYSIQKGVKNPHEANLLKLDCSKAHLKLKWIPNWDFEKTMEVTVRWYKEFYENGRIPSLDDLYEYIADSKNKRLKWV